MGANEKSAGSGKALPQAFVLGANHLTASVALRDKLLFSETELPGFSRSLLAVPGMLEVVVLSTCNRSEIYAISDQPSQARALIEKIWGASKSVSEDEIRN